jgi:hypothetical protein
MHVVRRPEGVFYSTTHLSIPLVADEKFTPTFTSLRLLSHSNG